MTTLNGASELILAEFVTEWGSTTPYAFTNEEARTLDAGEVAWCWVSVSEVGGGQDTLGAKGNRKYWWIAEVTVQVFTPVGEGSKDGETLAKQAKDIYEGERLGGLYFNDGRVTRVGPSEEKWDQNNAVIRFGFEEIK